MKDQIFQSETQKKQHQNKQPTNKYTSKSIMTNCLMTAIMWRMQPKRVPLIFTDAVHSNLILLTKIK